MSQVFIVGAGTGDVELLTMKAHRILPQADIILYDRLVCQDILSLSPNAEKIYVGRKSGDATPQHLRQKRIHELVLRHFQQNKCVVRLKSGDAYIYGRAAEEVAFLRAHHIPFQVIPGLSAGMVAANLCHIPLTERAKSHAVMICTANTTKNDLPTQLHRMTAALAQGSTLILYMALKNIAQIAQYWLNHCAVPLQIHAISQVSRPGQQHLVGTPHTIEAQIIKHRLQPPVVFIVRPHDVSPPKARRSREETKED